MSGLVQDLRVAVRSLLASPLTTGAALLVITLGVGANLAVFAVTYGILVRPLPYKEASRLATLSFQTAQRHEFGVPLAEVGEWRRRLQTVEALAGYSVAEQAIRGSGETQLVRTALVTESFFQVLGGKSARGALSAFRESPEVAVISEELARSLMGGIGDAGEKALGESITVGDRASTIGAVMAPDFTFPSDRVMAWIPAVSKSVAGSGKPTEGRPVNARPMAEKTFRMIARLRSGVTHEQLSADAERVIRDLHGEHAATPGGSYPEVTLLEEAIVGDARPALGAAVVAAILVLLVTCANVAMILLGRAALRRRDLAVRVALGASTWRLARGSLVESLVLATAGSLSGVGLASQGLGVVLHVAADHIPRSHAIAIDGPILLGGVAMLFIVALACGLAPALAASRQSFAAAFRAGSGGDPGRPFRSPLTTRRLLSGLVVAQLASSVILLTGAVLLATSVARLLAEDAGYEPGGAVGVRLSRGEGSVVDPIEQTRFVRRVVESVAALPGVEAAGIGSSLPPQGLPFRIQVRFMTETRTDSAGLSVVAATAGYLEALGVDVVSGRRFVEADDLSGLPVVLLSESAARFYSPDEDLTGRELPFLLPPVVPWDRPPRVLGIVRDVKYSGLDQPASPAIYVPWSASPTAASHLVWRTSGEVSSQTAAVRRVLEQADASLPIPDVRSLTDQMAMTVVDRRLRVVPAVGFAAVALTVALIGVFAVLARAAAERRRELAIRLALGASRRVASAVLMRPAVMVTSFGVAVGAGAALMISQGLRSLLYGISPSDPWTVASVVVCVAASSLLAAWLPARLAVRVPPAVLLRSE